MRSGEEDVASSSTGCSSRLAEAEGVVRSGLSVWTTGEIGGASDVDMVGMRWVWESYV